MSIQTNSQQTVTVTAKDGTHKTLHLPSTGDRFGNIITAIKAAGLSGKEGLVVSSPYIVSSHPVLGAAAASSSHGSSTSNTASSSSGSPDPNINISVWQAVSMSDIPPSIYPKIPVQISLVPTDIAVFTFGGNLGAAVYYSLKDLLTAGWVFNPPFPDNIQLKTSGYWQRISSHTVQQTDSFTDKTQYTVGTSETDSLTLSAELGVTAGAFSAKMSGSTTYTDTLTTQSQTEHDISVNGILGKQLFWVLWQYVEVYEIVDGSGNPIGYEGTLINTAAGFAGWANFLSQPIVNQTDFYTTHEDSFPL